MFVAVITVKLYAPWVQSLKDKRMVVKSLLDKIRNKFNVSACEVDQQDMHQTAVIAIAAIAADHAQSDSILDHVLNFIESNTEAEIVAVDREER